MKAIEEAERAKNLVLAEEVAELQEALFAYTKDKYRAEKQLKSLESRIVETAKEIERLTETF